LAIFDKQAKEGEIKLAVEFEGMYENNLDENGRPNTFGDLGPFGLGRLKDMILYGDQHRILQVVINLVSNSLKFTPPGGAVTLVIRCVGEAHMSDSRKASLQSRQSSTRHSKTRFRTSSSEVGSVSIAPSNYETANVINALEKPSSYANMMAQERAATPPPGRWLSFEFEVEDTGPGIPDNLHAKIFEPFVQGDLGLSKKYGGTGLGLSICSQLAGLMKGTIGLKSEVGKGSVFTMQIPLKHLQSRADSSASSSNNVPFESTTPRRSVEDTRDAMSGLSMHSTTSAHNTNTAPGGPVAFDADTQPRLVGLSQPFFASTAPLESPNSQAAAVQRIEAEATKRGGKVKVLVAEDNKTNQEVVLRMLKLEDVYDVTVAKDGQEALDKVRESMEHKAPYNLIFMDVQMPNLDGLQSTRLIRASGFSSPIVALTAYAEESNVKVRTFHLNHPGHLLTHNLGMSRFRHGLLPLQTHPSPRPQTRSQNLLPTHHRRRRRINNTARLEHSRTNTSQRPHITTTTARTTSPGFRAVQYRRHQQRTRISRCIARHSAHVVISNHLFFFFSHVF
jgi:osomolarity two-component system sensor histidine kinase SLN1